MAPTVVPYIYQPATPFAFILFHLCYNLRTLWGECSACDSSNSAEWKCPLAAQVYNALADNPTGSAANIIETSGGQGNRAENNAVLPSRAAASTFDKMVFLAHLLALYRLRTAVVRPPSDTNPSTLLPTRHMKSSAHGCCLSLVATALKFLRHQMWPLLGRHVHR